MRPVADPELPEFVRSLPAVETWDEVREVLTSPDFAMSGAEEREIFLGDTILTTEGARHSEMKQLFAPLMSRQAIAYYELHLVGPVIAEALAGLKARVTAEGAVRFDVVPLIHAALARISASVTGVDNVDTPERIARFRELVLTLGTATTGVFSKTPNTEMIRRGRAAVDELVRDYLQVSLERRVELVRRHRAGEIGREDLPRDVLTALCLADDIAHPDDDVRIPYVWRQCSQFLAASIKTTSHALPHVFVHVDEWLHEHPEDRDKLTDTGFLHRAVAESLRLHQSTPVKFRTALRDLTLASGRKVRAGEMLGLNAHRANTDEAAFGPDARMFDPWREVPGGMPHWGVSFSMGVHLCLGRNLVTGIQNRDDDKTGAHGTAVRILKAVYELGAALDPDHPPQRAQDSLHDAYDSVPMIIRAAS